MKKILAWYLPQFHYFKENNEIWGEKFCEWTLFKNKKINNYTPNTEPFLFYNLEDYKIRKYHANIAKKYNIYGFCYYHYWFNKPVMNRIIDLMLLDGEPNIPFCLCWANENWKKSMNGGNNEITIKQNYDLPNDTENHFNYLINFFKHKNYIKIENKPIFIIYNINEIKNYKERLEEYKKLCKKNNIEEIIFINCIKNGFEQDNHTIISQTINYAVEFYPNFLNNNNITTKNNNYNLYEAKDVYEFLYNFKKLYKNQFKGSLINFNTVLRNNKISNVIINNNLELFKKSITEQFNSSKEEFIFINAWNEWSENAILEPSKNYGKKYLKIIKNLYKKKY